MSLFKDVVYDNMDEVSQLIEPFECKVNNELAQFPDEFTLTPEDIHRVVSLSPTSVGNHGTDTSLTSIIERKARELNLEQIQDVGLYLNKDFVTEFFSFEIEEDTTYNAQTNTLDGKVTIVKKKSAYDERELEEHSRKYLRRTLDYAFTTPSSINRPRINELLDLFGVKEGLVEGRALGKLNHLINNYIKLMENRELNIRDLELLKRFVNWNIKYIRDGNLPALSNITKIKIMMRNGLPIYSLKEDQV